MRVLIWEGSDADIYCFRVMEQQGIHIIELTVHGLSIKQIILICEPHSHDGMGADSKNFPVNFAQ